MSDRIWRYGQGTGGDPLRLRKGGGIEMPGPTTSGLRIPQSVWDLAGFWMNEDLSREEATALAIMGAKNEQREADAKIAEMNGSPEIAAAIRGDRDKSQLPAEIRTSDDEA